MTNLKRAMIALLNMYCGAKLKESSEFSVRNEKKISLGADDVENSRFRRLGIF